MAIILRLDRVMADRKMSLNELSELVGVSNVNLSKLKTGKVSAVRFSTLNTTVSFLYRLRIFLLIYMLCIPISVK